MANGTIKEDTAKDLSFVKAIGHPYRVEALRILNRNETASPKEMAKEIGISVGSLSYHIRILRDSGYIELVDTRQRRGATEHFYKANTAAAFDEEQWVRIPLSIRGSIVGVQLTTTGSILSKSLADGSFERRPSRHHSLIEKTVDEQAWGEVMNLLDETMEQIDEIMDEGSRRVKGEDCAAVPLVVSMIGFEAAGPLRGPS